MKKELFVLILILLFFQGCSSKQEVVPPSSVKDIVVSKKETRIDTVTIKKGMYKNAFKVYVDSDDEIKFICFHGGCEYASKEEDIVWLYQHSFYPDFSTSTKGIQCGHGSKYGWLVLFEPDMLENHTKKNSSLCNSRFTTLDSMQISDRVIGGVITLGTSLVTSGSMYTVKFDYEEFREVIAESNLDIYQDIFYNSFAKHDLKYGIDVMYLDGEDIESSLEDIYQTIKFTQSKRDGILFLDENTKQIITAIFYDDYKDKNIMKNILAQINDVLNAMKTKINKNLIIKSDVIRYIPSEVLKPTLPALPKLFKDEFETKKEFQVRVYSAVKKREENIKQLQNKYDLEVFERNTYIKNLENSYNNYLAARLNQKNMMIKGAEKNIGLLSKILFITNLYGFNAKEFNYDPEIQNLYFTIYSNRDYFYRKMIAKIPVVSAKNIKRKRSFKIEPLLKFQNSSIILDGFSIYEPLSDKTFNAKYTNKRFLPISQKVIISTDNENIDMTYKSYNFQNYIQPDSKIVDSSKKEIWYIDVVNSINAKVPEWFAKPDIGNVKISYAEGNTLQEAKAEALRNLAYMIKVKISSTTLIHKEINGSFKSYTEIKKDIKTSTDVELSSDNYEVYKQQKMDGRWYIALEYKNQND